MYQTTPFLVFTGNHQAAITHTRESLASVGLQVLQSFDLQAARAAHTECTCPHHGTEQCNCQFVVLLIYEKDQQPVTLVAHGHDGKTYLAFVDRPDQRSEPFLSETIQNALRLFPPVDHTLRINSHAT